MKQRYTYKNPLVRLIVGLYDWFGNLFWKHRSPQQLSTPQRIVLIALHQIGDVIMDIPTIRATKQLFPNAKYTLIAGPGPCELLKDNAWGIEVVPFVAQWQKVTKQLDDGHTEITNPERQFVDLLNRVHYDIALIFHSDIHIHRLIRKTNIDLTIGYGIAGGGFHLTHPLTMPESGQQAKRTFLIAETLANIYKIPPPDYTPPTLPKPTIESSKIKKPYVVIHPFASAETKNWSQKSWIELVKWLTDHNFQVAIIGGPNDKIELTTEHLKKIIQFAGTLSLNQSAALIAGANLFIGVDSGPGHIAAALGVPGITIFSSVNDVSRWQPASHGRWQTLHQAPSDRHAYPMELRELPPDTKGNPYTDGVTPEMVITAIKKLLK